MKRILFITSTRLGDAVLSTGLLDRLVTENPGARITVACGEAPAPLFAAMPGVAEVIPMRKRRFSLHWFFLWARCVWRWWDLVEDLRGSAISWCLPTFKRRVIHGGTREGTLHRVEELSRFFGLETPGAPRVHLDDQTMEMASRFIDGDGPVLAISPTANWAGKEWPAQGFIDLISALTGQGGLFPDARVAIFGAPDERDRALGVISSVPKDRLIDLAGRVDLPIVYSCLARCSLFIGNDSGLMHMAAASGIPTLGLFGPSQEKYYGPWGENCASVRTPETLEELVSRPGYHWTTTGTLMESLSVSCVLEAVKSLKTRCLPS